MSFTDIFIRRPVLAIVVSLLIFFIGLRSLTTLDVRQFPKFDSASISITTTYTGASPALMQGFITTPIEQAISTAEGIDYVVATSSQGQSKITAYIKLNYNSNTALVDIMSKVQQVKNQIPREALDPVILKSNTDGFPILFVGYRSDELSSAQITDYITRVVQPVLSTVEGVGQVTLVGGQPFAMRLWVDSNRMAARGITGEDVSNALLANNVQSAPGQAKGLFTIVNITTNTALEDVDQFSGMVVKATPDGTIVRMRDIATVELDAQNVTSFTTLDNKPAVGQGIYPTPSGNPLVIAAGVRKRLADLEHDLPPGLKMRVQFDSSLFIQASIDEVDKSIVMAIGTVILVIFLSLGTVRAVAIPVVTIPLAMVGAASLMLAAGFSINLLTLLAMVLAVGLVVDDAIVVVENVYRHIREGRTPVQAALIGARELVSAILVMTVTLAAVYAPIGLLGGVTGTLFREFAFTLAGSVIISGLVALTLSPMLSSVLLTREMSDGRFPRFVEHVFDRITEIYARRLKGSLDYRPAILLFAAFVLGSLFFLYNGAKKELAPTEDQGFFSVMLKAPQYANIDYMRAFTSKGIDLTQKMLELETRQANIGSTSQNTGQIVLVAKPWGQRSRTTTDLLAALTPELPRLTGVTTLGTLPSSLPGSSGGAPVQMVISSVNGYETIFRVMDEVKAAAQKSGLFVATDSDLDFNAPEIRLKIDNAKANALGVSMLNIANTLAALVGENYINLFSMAGRSYQVIPQVPRAERLNAETLTKYYVTASNGQEVPLSAVVSYELGSIPNANTEYDQLDSATFSGVPMPGVSMGDAVAFMEKTAKELLPEGFSHDYLGDSRQYVTEGNALVATFGFALIVIYLVLAAQFESLRDPLVVLVSVPMSVCGALIPLYFGSWIQSTFHVVGATINIYTQVGLVTLIGLISKHGILMVTFANDMQRREGLDRRSAIEYAAKIRLRPILMTTAAMVLGVMPLVLASGPGAASRFSIGLVITSGMSVGTLFTLFVLPAVYTFLAEDHRAEANSARRQQIAAVS